MPGLPKSEYEQNKLAIETLFIKTRIVGNTTQASIKTYSDGSNLVYHEDDTRAVTLADAAPGFALADLDNDAAPAVLGFVIPVGNAAEVIDVAVPTAGIVNVSLSGPMTAGVPTLKGASSTGVTLSSNLAWTLSCTGLDIDEDVATDPNCTFWTRVVFRKTQPGQVA